MALLADAGTFPLGAGRHALSGVFQELPDRRGTTAVLVVLLAALAGYALSRFRFRGANLARGFLLPPRCSRW